MAIAEIDEQLAGLDALEIEEDRESGARKAWAQVWPKLGAVGLAILLWQVVVWTGWRPTYALPGPGTVFPRFFDELGLQVTWRAIGITMRRASVGFALAIVIGGLIRPSPTGSSPVSITSRRSCCVPAVPSGPQACTRTVTSYCPQPFPRSSQASSRAGPSCGAASWRGSCW